MTAVNILYFRSIKIEWDGYCETRTSERRAEKARKEGESRRMACPCAISLVVIYKFVFARNTY